MRLDVTDRFRLNKRPSSSLIDTVPQGTSIPKIIHQTFHAAPWPGDIAANMEKLKRLNPEWEYRFYDDDDIVAFIASHYGQEVLALYNSIDKAYGAARADLFRYLLIYRQGGVYLDIKSTADRPLDEVVRRDDTFLLSTWRNEKENAFGIWGVHRELRHLPYGEYQQWYIAAAPGHPFLKEVIEFVLRNIRTYLKGVHDAGAYAVLRVTGPVAYTLAIEPLRGRYPHRLVDSRADLGFVYSIFDRNADRVHEKVFSHYSKVEKPLVASTGLRSSLDAMLVKLRAGYRRLKRR